MGFLGAVTGHLQLRVHAAYRLGGRDGACGCCVLPRIRVAKSNHHGSRQYRCDYNLQKSRRHS
eukprot:2988598-Prymnesium_polylepis.1